MKRRCECMKRQYSSQLDDSKHNEEGEYESLVKKDEKWQVDGERTRKVKKNEKVTIEGMQKIKAKKIFLN